MNGNVLVEKSFGKNSIHFGTQFSKYANEASSRCPLNECNQIEIS